MDIEILLFDSGRLRETSINEEEKKRNSDLRNDFESDLGRAIFSSAARRLHDKTQVIPLTTDDNIHSRLTHSLEAMNIGASLAKDICYNEKFRESVCKDKQHIFHENMRAILQTACLVHDIGNPPFGHFGESAICDYFRRYFSLNKNVLDAYEPWSLDFTEFDGNAQGFRVITKLQFIDNLFGLNLTKSSLAAYVKYPNTGAPDKASGLIGKKKHGIFLADKTYLEQIMPGKEMRRHPLTFLVEAADSICYLSMDIEDAYNKRWISTDQLYNSWKSFSEGKKITDDANAVFSGLSEDSSHNSKGRKKMITLRINIIKYLVALAVRNFVDNFDKIIQADYQKELIRDDANNVAKFLQDFCSKNIYKKKDIMSVELTGHSVINGLLNIYMDLFMSPNKECREHGEAMISKSILRANKLDYLVHEGLLEWDASEKKYKNNAGDFIDDIDAECDKLAIGDIPNYYRIRIIVDFISGMTDKFAVKHYQKLSGQRI